MARCLWQFKTKHFKVQWLIRKDPLDTQYMEPGLARECARNVKSGHWQCFESEIRVTCRLTQQVLGAAYLGNSIYENPADFRDHLGMNQRGHGSYFSEMVREAVAEARENFSTLQAQVRKNIAAEQKLLALPIRTNRVVEPA